MRAIAGKLGRLSLSTELIFGIFSRGTRACSREDFKYCCLQRLDLKDVLGEREIDQLLDHNIGKQPNVTQDDFVRIFRAPIERARQEYNLQHAIDQSTIQAYEQRGYKYNYAQK